MKKVGLIFVILILAALLPTSASQASDDPSQWYMVPLDDPPMPRSGHSLLPVTDDQNILFGGEDENGVILDDLHVLPNFGNAWSQVPKAGNWPPARSQHTAWANNDQMYVFGGKNDTQAFNDLWRYDPGLGIWEALVSGGEAPPARSAASATVLPDGKVLLSGGKDTAGQDLNDTWLYDMLTNLWQQKSDAPFSFSGAGSAFLHNHVLLFATQPGSGETTVVSYYPPSDFWYVRSYHPDALRPPALEGAAYTSDGYKVWMVGGKHQDGTFSDTDWEYNNGSQRWVRRARWQNFDLQMFWWAALFEVTGLKDFCDPDAPDCGQPDTYSAGYGANTSTATRGLALFGGLLSTDVPTNTTFISFPSRGSEILLLPEYDTDLSYSDGQSITTTIQAPAGLVTETTILALTASPEITHTLPISSLVPGGLFALGALTDPLGEPLPGFALSAPITVTLQYNALRFDESSLWLVYWNGSQWLDATGTCAPAASYERNRDENWLRLPICRLGEFALVGTAQNFIYLPLVTRQVP